MARGGTPDPRVAALREELASLDLALVLALRARERVQHRILEWKTRRGRALVDPAQEERVRRRARAWARSTGGDPDLAADLVTAAVRSGLRRFGRPSPPGKVETVTCFVARPGSTSFPPPVRETAAAKTGRRSRPALPSPPPTDAWVVPRSLPTRVVAQSTGRSPGGPTVRRA